MRLQCGHLHSQYTLALRRQGLDNVTLEATQHQGLELLVQFLDLLLVVDI